VFRENSAVPSKATLEERLKEYPELKAKIKAMLGIIEKAAEAERRIIEELRQMGNEVLQGWARRQQDKKELEYNAKPGVNRKEKKPLLVHATGENRNRRSSPKAVAGRRYDPFLHRRKWSAVGIRKGLQRAMTDFGAENAFARAAAKLKEHYGIEVSVNVGGRRGDRRKGLSRPG